METLGTKGRGKKIQEEHRESLVRGQVLFAGDRPVPAVESAYHKPDNRPIFTWEILIGLHYCCTR